MKRRQLCDSCSDVLDHNERFDAYFCATCDKWTEAQCTDETCTYCKGRPAKPSEITVSTAVFPVVS